MFTALLALGCAAMAGGTCLWHQQWISYTNTCTCTKGIHHVAVIMRCLYARKAGFYWPGVITAGLHGRAQPAAAFLPAADTPHLAPCCCFSRHSRAHIQDCPARFCMSIPCVQRHGWHGGKSWSSPSGRFQNPPSPRCPNPLLAEKLSPALRHAPEPV